MRLLIVLFATFYSTLSTFAQENGTEPIDLSEKAYLAEVAYYNADYPEAEKLFSLVKNEYLARKNFVKAIDGSLGVARTKIAIGQFDGAVTECEKALEYLGQTEQIDSARASVIYRISGEAYLNSGLNELALEKLRSSENFLLQKNDLRHADLMEEIGVTYWNNGNQKLAREYHNRVLQVRMEALSEDDVEIGDSYLNLGLVDIKDGNNLSALVFFKKALAIYEGQGDGESNELKIANVYSNMAFANLENGAFALAGRYFENVAEIYDKIYEGDHPNKAFIEAILGRVEHEQENFEGAIERYDKALAIYKNVFGIKHPEVADTYARIGGAYQSIGDRHQGDGKTSQANSAYETALEKYQEAIYANIRGQEYKAKQDLPTLDRYLNADYLLSALASKAAILEYLHYNKSLKPRDINAALEAHILSDSLISRIKQLRLSEADKIRTSALSKEIYKNGIRVSTEVAERSINKKYYYRLAYQFFERSKASTLHEAINDTKAKNFAGIPEEVLDQEERLINEIVRLETRLSEQVNEEEEQAVSQQLFNKNREYRQFIKSLEENYPKYFSLKYNNQLASVDEIKAKLKSNEAILSYFIAEEKINGTDIEKPKNLYIMSITRKKLAFHQVELPENFLGRLKAFRNAIKYKSDKVTRKVGKDLFNLFFPTGIYDKYNFFTIIPDGAIGTIPFEALVDNEDNYVIERAGINYDFSANLYYSNLENHARDIKKVLAIAPVSFDSYEDLKLSTLPGTKREVERIKYNGAGLLDVNLWTNGDASEAEFKSTELQNYDIIHFATHGEVNESEPARSRIFLYNDKNNEEDGFLYSSEIYNIKLNADLITLSACETGLGKVAKGEGIIGLSRSLKYAGGKNLVVSLWKVADQSTSDLMIDFYQRQQINNFSFSMALRDAKLSLLYSDEYKSPYFWAPFILIGK